MTTREDFHGDNEEPFPESRRGSGVGSNPFTGNGYGEGVSLVVIYEEQWNSPVSFAPDGAVWGDFE